MQKKAWPKIHSWLTLPAFSENSCHTGCHRSHFPSCAWKGMRGVWHLPPVSAPEQRGGAEPLSRVRAAAGGWQYTPFPGAGEPGGGRAGVLSLLFLLGLFSPYPCRRAPERWPRRPRVVLLLKRVMLTGREVRNSSSLREPVFTRGIGLGSCVTLPASALRPAAPAPFFNIWFVSRAFL